MWLRGKRKYQLKGFQATALSGTIMLSRSVWCSALSTLIVFVFSPLVLRLFSVFAVTKFFEPFPILHPFLHMFHVFSVVWIV